MAISQFKLTSLLLASSCEMVEWLDKGRILNPILTYTEAASRVMIVEVVDLILKVCLSVSSQFENTGSLLEVTSPSNPFCDLQGNMCVDCCLRYIACSTCLFNLVRFYVGQYHLFTVLTVTTEIKQLHKVGP